MFVLAFAWCWATASAQLAQRLDPALEGAASKSAVPWLRAAGPRGGTRFRFATVSPPASRRSSSSPGTTPSMVPQAAERMTLLVRLRRPRGFANPGGSDHEARMLREGIGATGYVKSGTSEGRDMAGRRATSRAGRPR